MSQQRFHRAYAPTFEQAKEAKTIFETENPEGNYQIRRRRDNYEVVIRLPSDKAHAASVMSQTKRRRRRKRHAIRQGISEAS
jgi:hypothetical protein